MRREEEILDFEGWSRFNYLESHSSETIFETQVIGTTLKGDLSSESEVLIVFMSRIEINMTYKDILSKHYERGTTTT